MPYTRASWYSQLPAFGWFDREDRPGSNALGVPDWQQGIALPSRATLGRWFNVTPPGSTIPYPFQQTDTGPAWWTGRGTDISAAAAHQMGYTPKTFPTDAAFKIEPRDEPRALGSPAGLPVDAGDLPDNATGDAYAGPTPGGGKKMAGGLLDFLQPQQQDNSSFGDRIAANSNSLIGLGMGLLQPYNPWAGTNAWSNALQGYQVGARSDAQRQQDARDYAFRQQQARLAQSNFERTAQRLEQSPAEQMIADINKARGTPNEQMVRDFYAPKTEAWSLQEVGQDQWSRPIKMWVNSRTQEMRPLNMPPPGMAGGSAFTSGTGGVPYTTGGFGLAGASPQGPSQTAGAAPSGGVPDPNAPPLVTLPDGRTVAIPPGQDVKTIRQHLGAATGDVLAGKFTGEQAKAQLFANRMEVAKPILDKLDTQGTSVLGGGIERLPGSDKFLYGNLLQSKDYQQYRTARDAFINALLRNESGAAISTGEYTKIEKEMFPQPGDGPAQIANKRMLRDAALDAMKRAAGPGYQSPKTDEGGSTRASSGGTSAADTLRQELIRRGINPDQ